MEKDIIFFGSEGLTSTSANFVANLAKEYYQSLEIKLGKLQFYQTTVELLSSDVTKTLKEGTTLSELKQIPSMIKEIAQAKSLISWLREAIKARETLSREVQGTTLEGFCKSFSLEIPKSPELDHILTEDEYYGSLGIKERNAYYALETKCATLGKIIHPNGALAIAREDLKDKMVEPHKVSGAGRDATIYNYTPTVMSNEVDELFFALQTEHRQYQANLNSIKFECQKAIEASETAAHAKYQEEYSDYSMKMQSLNAALRKWKLEQNNMIGALKIVLPDSLKTIFEKVNALGKK